MSQWKGINQRFLNSKNYGWISTNNGAAGVGLSGLTGTTGSSLTSSEFTAKAGEELKFYFNFVTSDGGQYSDYGWARLLDTAGNEVALLFTARTSPTEPIVPGFGMPMPSATLNPSPVMIVNGAPNGSALGPDSGQCYQTGCGRSDWVESIYSIPADGTYVLEFGVVNWSDTSFQSGMAFDGLTIGGRPISGESGLSQSSLITTGAALDNGDVHVWGFRGSAQQGNGKMVVASQDAPARVDSLSGVTALTGGAYHLVALDSNGDIYGWGQSGYGETGCKPTLGIYVETPCKVMSDGVQIAAGEYFSIALDKNGKVWTWGHNLYGQLGTGVTGSMYNSGVPQQVNLQGETARLIGAAYEGAFAVTEEGHVWAWGDNEASGLGFKGSNYGVQRIEPTPTRVTGLDAYARRITYIAGGNGWGEALLDDGTVIGWGLHAAIGQGTTMTNISSPEPVVIMTDVKQLFARYVGSFALTNDGQMFTWGQTGGSAFKMIYGEAPSLRTGTGKVIAIGGGKEHLFYKTDEGKVYGVGYNDLYKLDQSKCCAPNIDWPGKEITLAP